MEGNIDDISNTSIKSSPNYEQQADEIELLKNIIPEKIKILKEEPNFNIQIEIEANDTESQTKKFILLIYLNFDYPEKSPDFKIYEINNYLSDKSKEKIEKKLFEYCEENKGFPVIYQLYEMCQDFANAEEKIAILEKYEEKKGENPYQLAKLKKIKSINDVPKDVILLKNGDILIINEDNNIIIFDNQLEKIKLETFDYQCNSAYCKYIPSDSKEDNDYLYCFTNEAVLVYEINYMPKKIISDINKGKAKIKISGNVKINYIDKIESMTDVIEFDNFNKSSFFINKKYSSALFYKYNKVKRKNGTIMAFDEWYVTNEFKTIFRRLYKINSQKFIIASYTLKSYDEDAHLYQIEGKNIMVFIDSNNFKIGKCHNIKISPLNNTICNFKNKYIILSYYDTLEDKNHIKRKNKGEQYTFENLDFMSEFYAISNYHFSDYWDNHWNDDNDNNNEHYYKPKYFSYDITEHLIGIFSIKTEELVTIYEFDPIKILYNINDNILCLFEKSKDKRKKNK